MSQAGAIKNMIQPPKYTKPYYKEKKKKKGLPNFDTKDYYPEDPVTDDVEVF